MAADNQTTIAGNLVDDPELRFTNTGIAVANMRVAVTQRIQQDGQWRRGVRTTSSPFPARRRTLPASPLGRSEKAPPLAGPLDYLGRSNA